MSSTNAVWLPYPKRFLNSIKEIDKVSDDKFEKILEFLERIYQRGPLTLNVVDTQQREFSKKNKISNEEIDKVGYVYSYLIDYYISESSADRFLGGLIKIGLSEKRSKAILESFKKIKQSLEVSFGDSEMSMRFSKKLNMVHWRIDIPKKVSGQFNISGPIASISLEFTDRGNKTFDRFELDKDRLGYLIEELLRVQSEMKE
jgi:hypothetical protein